MSGLGEVISSNLTRGTQAAVDHTPVDHGKLRFSTDEQRLFMDYNNTRIEYTDIIRGLTDAQIKNLAKPINKIYVASDTHYLYYPSGSYDASNKPIYIMLNDYHVSSLTVASYNTNYNSLTIEFTDMIGTKTTSVVTYLPKSTYVDGISSTATSGVNKANAAQSTANSAVTAAANAQSTANSGVSKANAAQSTADSAATAAANAQSTADSGVSKANAAQATADAALPKAGGEMTGTFYSSIEADPRYHRRVSIGNGIIGFYKEGQESSTKGWIAHGIYDNRNIDISCDSLFINGTVDAYDYTTHAPTTTESSKRYKENIKQLSEEEALKILGVEPVIFDYKDRGELPKKTDCRGVIAEQVYPIIPSVVSMKEIDGEIVPDGIRYSEFIPYLIKMVQMQQKEIDELKKKCGLE